MKTNTMNTPRIYVGTYAKYNNGSIKGEWLDLEDYSDKDAFLDACRELHKDESDPELMFQDFEGFPCELYSESSIDDRLWEYVALSEDDREVVDVYADACEFNIEAARENFQGKYDSEEDWAEQFLNETHPAFYENKKENEVLTRYFDYAAYARDAQMGGDMVFHRHDGDVWVFFNH